MKTADVREMMYDAFANTSAPSEADIVPVDCEEHLERREIRQAFCGHAWHELQLPTLTYHRQALFFFTPRAWAYYLPAYMRAVMDEYEETGAMLGSILSSLTPTRDSEIESIRKARLRALTGEQRDTVRAFVCWGATEHPEDIDDDERDAVLAGMEDIGD